MVRLHCELLAQGLDLPQVLGGERRHLVLLVAVARQSGRRLPGRRQQRGRGSGAVGTAQRLRLVRARFRPLVRVEITLGLDQNDAFRQLRRVCAGQLELLGQPPHLEFRLVAPARQGRDLFLRRRRQRRRAGRGSDGGGRRPGQRQLLGRRPGSAGRRQPRCRAGPAWRRLVAAFPLHFGLDVDAVGTAAGEDGFQFGLGQRRVGPLHPLAPARLQQLVGHGHDEELELVDEDQGRVAVHDGLVLDVPGTVGVPQRVEGLVETGPRRRHAADHQRLGVAAQRVLQDARDFADTVRHVHLAAFGVVAQRADHVPQREQPFVDVDAFFELQALRAAPFRALAAGEVHEGEFAPPDLLRIDDTGAGGGGAGGSGGGPVGE